MTNDEQVALLDKQIDAALVFRQQLEKEAEKIHREMLELNQKLRELGRKKSELLTLELKLEP